MNRLDAVFRQHELRLGAHLLRVELQSLAQEVGGFLANGVAQQRLEGTQVLEARVGGLTVFQPLHRGVEVLQIASEQVEKRRHAVRSRIGRKLPELLVHQRVAGAEVVLREHLERAARLEVERYVLFRFSSSCF